MKPTPTIKLLVNKFYITNIELGFEEAYLMAVDARANQALRFTVYLKSGAIWSGLPIEALMCSRYGPVEKDPNCYLETASLQPFSCLEGPVEIITYELLKDADLEVENIGPANYLFTINYTGAGLAEDPEQHKTHNIVVLDNGQLGAFPNNMIKVVDNWFSDATIETKNYRRVSKTFFPGG